MAGSRLLLAAAVLSAYVSVSSGFAFTTTHFSTPQLRRGEAISRSLPGHASISMQERKDDGSVRTEDSMRARPSSLALSSSLAVLAVVLPTAAGATPPEWLEPTRSSLDIGLAIFSLFFFLRIPITWYPEMDLNEFPQAIVAKPTEPFCKLVRGFLPPLFGVDISPIFLYGILSFIREIFLGQQGVLTIMAGK